MIRLKLLFPLLLPLTAVILLAACSPSLVITVHPDDSADIAFSANPSPAGSSLTRRVTGADDDATPLYDRDAVSEGLSGMGIRLETLSFPSGDGLAFSGSVSSLAHIPGGALVRTASPEGITLSLSPESVNAVLGKLPTGTQDILELLMAPILTGEQLSREEYRDILAAAYGERAAEELATASCTIHLRTPQPVRSAVFSGPDSVSVPIEYAGNTVSAAIPLDLLLTLSAPLNLTVSW